jgi:hypothetical protein
LLRLQPYRIHLLLFVIGLGVFGAVAGSRIARQSSDPHFVFQADAWLHGHLAIDPPPQKGDDWAKVETVLLRDGSTAAGRRLQSRPVFLTLRGDEIPLNDVVRTDHITHFVSFPPFPAVLMLPQTAISGRRANDVIPTLLIAALVLPLCFATLRRLADAGMSRRTVSEDLWLVACLAFGTVFFFSAVQGRVWFTAHVVGVALALGYAWASIEARRPLIAGLCLGLATMTRTPMAFMFPLFLLEAWRMAGEPTTDARARLRPFLRRAARFAAPVVAIAAVAVAYNVARFGAPTEFGHSYLAVRQQAQIEAHGLFSYSYLARNLAVAFTLLPDFFGHAPYVTISGHGLALWLTTPAFLLLLWPAVRNPLHRALWITVAFVAIPTFFYQNSGWLQFGYRFSLDYTAFLVLLLAVGGRPLGRGSRALIAVGIAINLFGAITFARFPQFYRADNATYQTVVKH